MDDIKYRTLEELVSNIEKIKSDWLMIKAFRKRRKYSTFRARTVLHAISNLKKASKYNNPWMQNKLDKVYIDVLVELFKHWENTANKMREKFGEPADDVIQLYWKVSKDIASSIEDERKMMGSMFMKNMGYTKIRHNKHFFAQVKSFDMWKDALVTGAKTAMLYEIKQIGLRYPAFKGRASSELLRFAETAKEAGLSNYGTRGYIYFVTGKRYNQKRIDQLLNKLSQ